jgi:hypothetical protein
MTSDSLAARPSLAMTHAVNNPGMLSYHHCAVLEITPDPRKPIDSAWPKER